MRILGISAFYHDSAAALVVDGADRRGCAGGALHAQEARRRLPAATPSSYCLAEARHQTRPSSITSRSTTSRSSSSSGCSRPTSRLRRAASSRSAWRMPVWLREKLFQKDLLQQAAEPPSVRASTWAETSAVRRASPEPRGQRVLSLAVRAGRGADDGRRRRVGDDLGRRWARATDLEIDQARFTFRTRSGCCTRRSLTTPASRSTPASTR